MEFGNLINLKQSAIAEKIGMKPAAAATCLQKYKKYLIPYYIYEKNLHFSIKTSLFFWRFRTISVLLHFRINNSTH